MDARAGCIFLLLVRFTQASHFDGGTIYCDGITQTSAKCYWKTGWILNAGSGPCCGQCSASSLGSLSPCSGAAWKCITGSCIGSTIVGSSPYTLTGWNTQNNWEQGENSFTYDFGSSSTFTIGYEGCCWRNLDFGNNDGDWSIRTTFNLGSRSDTSKGNSSPRTLSSPVYRMQYGCGPTDIVIPMSDNDGDLVQCRMAVGAECNDACLSIPHTTLSRSSPNCVLTIDASGASFTSGGWYAVALIVEDFPRSIITISGRSYPVSTPISAIPLQFLVYTPTISASCGAVPVFVTPTPAASAALGTAVGTPISVTVQAEDTSGSLVNSITVSGPAGGTVSPTSGVSTGAGKERYVTWTWTPAAGQEGGNAVCFQASDGLGKASEYRCVTVGVGVSCADPGMGTNADRTPSGSQTFNFADVATYTCQTGHQLVSGSSTRTCQLNGAFDGIDYVCAPVTCPDPGMGTFADRVPPTSQTFNYGGSVTYTCQTGYVPSTGTATRNCQASGAFDGSDFICAQITCPDPGMGTNSDRTPSTSQTFNSGAAVTYTCQSGYSPSSGDASRTCQSTGVFNGSALACTLVTCPDPGMGTRADRSPAQTKTFNYAETVTYICQTGYQVSSGSASRTCQANGDFDGSDYVCTIIPCTDPGLGTNAVRTPSSGSFVYNNVVSYSCKTGYSYASGSENRTCGSSGSFDGSPYVCNPVPCSDPGQGTNALRSPPSGSFVFGDVVRYSCQVGFQFDSGSVNRTCGADSNFDGTPYACTPVPCPDPGQGTKSLRVPAGGSFVFRDVVRYSCAVGHLYDSGSYNRTCAANGAFDGAPFVCRPVPCPNPGFGTNAVRTPANGNFVYQDEVYYSCKVGHFHDSGSQNRTCEANGSFNGSDFICLPVPCPDPEFGINAARDPPNGTFVYEDVARYTCFDGYSYHSGTANRTCQANGTFDGSDFRCMKDESAAAGLSDGEIYGIVGASAGAAFLAVLAVVMCCCCGAAGGRSCRSQKHLETRKLVYSAPQKRDMGTQLSWTRGGYLPPFYTNGSGSRSLQHSEVSAETYQYPTSRLSGQADKVWRPLKWHENTSVDRHEASTYEKERRGGRKSAKF